MIRIEGSKGLTIIKAPVNEVCDSLGYCEHKIPFFMQGIKPPQSIDTMLGSAMHKREEEEEKKHFVFVPLNQAELADATKDVEFAREKIFTRLLIPMEAGSIKVLLLVYGRADKVLRKEETLIIQDDKSVGNVKKYDERNEPFDDQKLQALIYLNSKYSDTDSWSPKEWFEIPHKKKMWFIQIRDRTNNDKTYRIFKGEQNIGATKYLNDSLERFARLILGLEERKHHNLSDKCRPCRYVSQCEFRL